MITPKVVPIVSLTGLAGLVLVAILAFQVQRSDATEERRDCDYLVTARSDSRAMWLYLLDQANPDQTPEEQERFDAFVVELDKRLPELKCENGDPVPVKEVSEG